MSLGGTARYVDLDESSGVPDLVLRAARAAQTLGFPYCCRPEIGRLLAVLAGGLPGGSLVAESGTGTGVGLAWMVSAARDDVRFVSAEIDADRSAAAASLFEGHSNVEVLHANSQELYARGPFDLFVHDGGPGAGKAPGDVLVEPRTMLRPGGTMTVDDYSPADSWPPLFEGKPDSSRVVLVEHEDLVTTEIQVAPDLAVVVARYLPAR